MSSVLCRPRDISLDAQRTRNQFAPQRIRRQCGRARPDPGRAAGRGLWLSGAEWRGQDHLDQDVLGTGAAHRRRSGTLLGAPLGNRAARANVGFLPEHFRFHDWLSADEFLKVHGELYGMRRDRLARRRDELLELVGLTPFRRKTLRTFSKGMLQRVGLAQALLNEPALVFLDEPTSGLDPVGRRLVRDIIRDLRAKGTTVFLNSHLLSEVEITCDRVAFIKHGEVVRISELKTLVEGETRVTLRASRLDAGRTGRVEPMGPRCARR